MMIKYFTVRQIFYNINSAAYLKDIFKGTAWMSSENKMSIDWQFDFAEHFFNDKKRRSFDKHYDRAKRVSIKAFGKKQFDKHYYSTVGCFMKVLAVLSLINTVVVLWVDSLKFWRQNQQMKVINAFYYFKCHH